MTEEMKAKFGREKEKHIADATVLHQIDPSFSEFRFFFEMLIFHLCIQPRDASQ